MMLSPSSLRAILAASALVQLVAAREGDAATLLGRDPFDTGTVRGGGGDLVLITGQGISATGTEVIYGVVDPAVCYPLGQVAGCLPPALPIAANTSTSGYATIVNASNVPHMVTIKLPAAVLSGQTYGLWLKDASGLSNVVLINDPRPLWFSPTSMAQTAGPTPLPGEPARVLKLIGRNLDPAPGLSTRVKLTLRSGSYETAPLTTIATNAALNTYEARVSLPAGMPVGTYDIRVSRDAGAHWVVWQPRLTAAAFQIVADPVAGAPPRFQVLVSAQGCMASDGQDDTWCIARALYLAYSHAGGGDVILGAGIWDYNPGYVNAVGNGEYAGPTFSGNAARDATCANMASVPHVAKADEYACLLTYAPSATGDDRTIFIDHKTGVHVPPGVNLLGNDSVSARTMIVRGAHFRPRASQYLFTLSHDNVVKNIDFYDPATAPPVGFSMGALQLGPPAYAWDGADPTTWPWKNDPVRDLVISDCTFGFMFAGIYAPARPLERVTIRNNTFGAFSMGLMLVGYRGYVDEKFSIKDSVIEGNTFYPGGDIDHLLSGGQGTIASNIHGAERLVFRKNVAQGDNQYYNKPRVAADGRPGFRAGFFFGLQGNMDEVLASENVGFCTGDKAGDGEFLGVDNNGASFPFYVTSPTPSGGTSTHVTAMPVVSYLANGPYGRYLEVQGTVASVPYVQQAGTSNPVTVTRDFYKGHYVTITNGAGLGQVRKVTRIEQGAGTNRELIYFEPALTLEPNTTLGGPEQTRVIVSTLPWQFYIVGNTSDQSACGHPTTHAPTNRNGKYYPGTISFYSSAAHSVIEGNTLVSTGGIILMSNAQGGMMQYFTEVAENVISGEFLYDSMCSVGGIQLRYGGDPALTADVVRQNTGVGVQIARNQISHSTAFRGGAITIAAAGGLDSKKGMLSPIIQLNDVADLPRTIAVGTTVAPAANSCHDDAMLAGTTTVHGEEPLFWSTYQTTCINLSPYYASATPAVKDGWMYGAALSGNTCQETLSPLQDSAENTVVVP